VGGKYSLTFLEGSTKNFNEFFALREIERKFPIWVKLLVYFDASWALLVCAGG